MVGGGRDRPQVAAEVVGFRGGRTLLMPLGELHGIGPGTSVTRPAGRSASPVGEPLLGRVIDGLAGRSTALDPPSGVSWRERPARRPIR